MDFDRQEGERMTMKNINLDKYSPFHKTGHTSKGDQHLSFFSEILADARIYRTIVIFNFGKVICDKSILQAAFLQKPGNKYLRQTLIAHIICFVPDAVNLPFSLISFRSMTCFVKRRKSGCEACRICRCQGTHPISG